MNNKYGWVPDVPDHRDFMFLAPPTNIILPESVDLRPLCPPVFNQGQLGSCTSNALAAAYEFELFKDKKTIFRPSRLFIYYNERAMEGTILSDAGAMIRDGIKTMNSQGVCHDNLLPYDIEKFTIKPADNCYADALKNTITSYQRVVPTINNLKTCLAAGFPFVFGFTVYESFEGSDVAATGTANMPDKSEQCMGGHAVMCVGYNDLSQRFIIRNSWGPDWGMKGYFTLPYAYVTSPDLADDFWTIRVTTSK